MHIHFTDEMKKKIAVYSISAIIAILVYFLIARFDGLMSLFAKTFDILLPFLVGALFAFVLNGPMNWVDEHLFKNSKLRPERRAAFSAMIVFIAFVLILIFSVWITVPSLIDSLRHFLRNLSDYASAAEEGVTQLSQALNLPEVTTRTMLDSLGQMFDFTKSLTSLIPTILNYSIDIVGYLFDFIVSVVSCIYILLDKKNLARGFKRINYAFLPKQIANWMVTFLYDAKNVFEQYIIGNIIDSAIVGVVTWAGMLIAGVPYSPMIGFIVGITNLIPVFGPFLGAIPVILLLLLINPLQALFFAVFILVLQQIDGNILKPIILGDKMGLSGFWILFSVTIGGALFGVIGMFLAVPVFALVYTGVSEIADWQLKQKHLDPDRKPGIIE